MKTTICWHKPSTSLFITPISFFPVYNPYIFWPSNSHCSHQHSYHDKQPAAHSEFKWRDTFGSQKCNNSKLLKGVLTSLSGGFRFHTE